MAAMFFIDVMRNNCSILYMMLSQILNVGTLYFQKLQCAPVITKFTEFENPPTNISATARLITKYKLPLQKGFLIKTIAVITFSVTIATDSVMNTASQALHSGEEKTNIWKSFLLLSVALTKIINHISVEKKRPISRFLARLNKSITSEENY